MSYHTVEHKVTSMRGWKRPLYSGSRVYRTLDEVKRRIRQLAYEYGTENVAHMPKRGDPTTEVVYIRLD